MSKRDALFDYLSNCGVVLDSDEDNPISVPSNAIIAAIDDSHNITYLKGFLILLEDAIEADTGQECTYIDCDEKKVVKLLQDYLNELK